MTDFKKSSKCGTNACVEVDNVSTPDKIVVRDAFGNTCTYTYTEWKAFVAGVKLGEFDI